ncbi:MAG: hypothetical protein J6Y91_01645 [Alphaproteobacteria bacterium]|nr:hypothetical protein [Alphaproteobacteria bacterium]
MEDNKIDYPCDLDQDSVDFLKAHLKADINPHLETKEDYNRAVFYFKACRLQQDCATMSSVPPECAKFAKYFDDKEKVDVLFNHLYAHALKFQDLTDKVSSMMDKGEMPDEKTMAEFDAIGMSGYAASTATLNEHLTPALHIKHGDRDIGNYQILGTVSMDAMAGYFAAFPDLDKILDAELAKPSKDKEIQQQLDSVRQKKAKEFLVYGGDKIDDVCLKMSEMANDNNTSYKATFNDITFVVNPGDDFEKAALSYAEKLHGNQSKDELLKDVKDYNEWGLTDSPVSAICSAVATKRIAEQYPEHIGDLSPIMLMNAKNQRIADGYLGLRIAHAFDDAVVQFIEGKDNIPLTKYNIKTLKQLENYIEDIPAFKMHNKDNALQKRIKETKEKFLKQEVESFGKEIHLTGDYLSLYKLAGELGDKKAQDVIAQTASPIGIYRKYQKTFGDITVNAIQKREMEKFLMHSLDMYMQGHDNIPASDESIKAMKDLRGYIRDICLDDDNKTRKYTHFDIEQRNTKLHQKFLDRVMQEDDKILGKLPTETLHIIADTASNFGKDSKYGDLLKKAETELAIRDAGNDGRGPK